MSTLLYCFIGGQLALVGITFSFILGSLVVFGGVIVSCFIASLVLLLLFKYSHLTFRWVFKKKKVGSSVFSKNLWIIFTGLVYLTILIIFFKIVEY
jgi:lysylphosphatidylglycerol synthetase-like protein (DUF2156 family)